MIQEKNKTIELKDLAIQERDKQISVLVGQVEDANKKLQSPTRNPFVVGTVGILIGILVTGVALK